jgi:thiol-disulfide isomerase/thioredoxin
MGAGLARQRRLGAPGQTGRKRIVTNGSGPKAGRSILATAAVLTAAALAGFGAVYVMARTPDNGGGKLEVAQAPAAPPAELPSGPGRNPLSVGEMAAFVFKKAPEPLPAFTFLDASAKERTLQDWKGKVVLLNLWATWCVPCRKEMPGLDRLQGELGSDQFEVVALSADRKGLEGSKQFLDQIKVQKLKLYADPSVRVTSTLKAVGMPATLLIDREGREIGRLTGPAEWDSAEAKALIKAALAQK